MEYEPSWDWSGLPSKQSTIPHGPESCPPTFAKLRKPSPSSSINPEQPAASFQSFRRIYALPEGPELPEPELAGTLVARFALTRLAALGDYPRGVSSFSPGPRTDGYACRTCFRRCSRASTTNRPRSGSSGSGTSGCRWPGRSPRPGFASSGSTSTPARSPSSTPGRVYIKQIPDADRRRDARPAASRRPTASTGSASRTRSSSACRRR